MEEAHFEIPLIIDGAGAIRLVASLQLALRHPGNTGNAAQYARRVIDGLKEIFERHGFPAHLELIDRGDDPGLDYDWRERGKEKQ